jgi:hypothetical protein
MKPVFTKIALTAMLSVGITTFAFAVDRVGTGTPGDEPTAPAAKKKADRKGESGMRSGDQSTSGSSADSGKDLSTPSKMDSGAPGTPGGATPGTSSGTETAPKTGSGK